MIIDTNFILSVLGILATILLSYLGIKYTLKYRKKTEIVFLKNASISLFKDIVDNIDDIEIRFRGEKIKENLILFKGTFFNSGNTDIEKAIVHKPVEIELPRNYRWVRYKLINSTDELDVTVTLENNKLIFGWDLLKEGEHFTFDSLIEYSPQEKEEIMQKDNEESNIEDQIFDKIKISHRITDLKGIKKVKSFSRTSPVVLFFISIVFLGIISIGSYYSFWQLLSPNYELYMEANTGNGKQYVMVTANSENTVLLSSENGEKLAIITQSEMPQKMGKTIEIRKEEVNVWRLSIVGGLTIIYFIFWVVYLVDSIRVYNRFRNLKSIQEDFISEKSGFSLILFSLR